MGTYCDCLIFSDDSLPNGTSTESASVTILNEVQSKLGIIVNLNEISVSQRLGKKPSSPQDHRPIIAKFCRRDLKMDILRKSRAKKIPGFFIGESLTNARREIFHTLRRMRKAHPRTIKGVTTIQGRVVAFTKPLSMNVGANDQRHYIMNHTDLKLFCDEFIKEPLEKFLFNNA